MICSNDISDSEQGAVDSIIRYLAGEPLDPRSFEKALSGLEERSPSELDRLVGVMGAESETLCDEVGEALADYAALGASAVATMPVVARHLDECPFCRAHLAVLQSTLARHDDWLAVAREIRERGQSILVLLQGVWHRLLRSGQESTPLRGETCGSHAMAIASYTSTPLRRENWPTYNALGSWQYAEPLKAISRFGGEEVQPLALTAKLPGDIGTIRLTVTPWGETSDPPRRIWEFKVALEAANQRRRIHVAIGDDKGPTTPGKNVSDDHPVGFALEPPGVQMYWLYCRFTLSSGQSDSVLFEIPLRDDLPRGP